MATRKKPSKPSPSLALAGNAANLICERSNILLAEFAKSARKISTKRIHDLRVASRRLRECLAVFQQILSGPGYKKPLRRTKKLTRMLGGARNLDVLHKILTSIIERQADTPEGRAARHYRRHITTQKKSARAQLEKDLQQYKSPSLEKSIAKLIQHLKNRPPEHLTPEILESALGDRMREIFSGKPDALDRSNVEAQHQLRIAIKKLRYRVEILRFAFGQGGQKTISLLTSLQDLLGEMHDHTVLLADMEQWVAQKNLPKKNPNLAEDYNALIRHFTDRNDALHAEFVRQFGPIEIERFRQALFENQSP